MKRNDNYSSKPRIVQYVVVTCCHCGDKTIYARQWLTMEGWAMDRATRKWLCPACTGRFDRGWRYDDEDYEDYEYDIGYGYEEEALSGASERAFA